MTRRDVARRYLAAARREAGPLVIVLLVAVVAAAVGYLVAIAFGLDSRDYWTATLPTIVAVVGGVGLAWWGIRIANTVEAAEERDEASARRTAVLAIIEDELTACVRELRGDRAVRPRKSIVPLLPVEAWRSLSASGELRWIDDPTLIAKLANAYFRIDATTMLERQRFTVANDPGVAASLESVTSRNMILNQLASITGQQDPYTIAAIDVALAAISEVLRPGVPYVSPEVAAAVAADKPKQIAES